MLLSNHHAHSTFSDGKDTAENFLLSAINQGLEVYGFSDHAPIPVVDRCSMKLAQLPEYLAEVDRLREVYADRIRVYKSMEVDYLSGEMSVDSPHIKAAKLDYTVGAVHYVEKLDGEAWSFQRPNPTFNRGINEIFGGSARRCVERYYELVREMVSTHPPDIVAHLDRIKKRNQGHWDEHAPWYKAAIRETLEVIGQSRCILEVNTRGLYRGEIEDTYPSRWIVEQAINMGIPLQVNSDAHEPQHVAGSFEYAYRMLDALGAQSVRVYDGTTFDEVAIEELSWIG